jgi:multiple sugar transport system substrate-binding protein
MYTFSQWIFNKKFNVDLKYVTSYCHGMKRYLLAVVFLSLMLASCGTEKSETIAISWWHFWTDATIKPVMVQIVEQFEQTHPDVNVELVDLTWADGHDKIAIAFSSGTGPDIVELGSDWIPEFSSTGHLHDITEWVKPVQDDYLMWEPTRFNGAVYAFPWILGTRVLFANRELLIRAGFDPDYTPASWDDLLASSEKINNLDDDVYAFGSNSAERHRLYKKFLPFLWANGGSILSTDGKSCLLDSPDAVGALEYYLKLCNIGLTDTQRRLEDVFLEGKIGFVLSGDWLLKRIAREKPDFDFSTHLIPGPEGLESSVSFAGGEYLAINAKSKYKELAYELIKHICSFENELLFCMKNRTANPALKIAAADSTFLTQPHFETFVRQMAAGRMPPVHPQWVYIEAEFEKAIEAALYGTKSAQAALSDACVKIEELLEQ